MRSIRPRSLTLVALAVLSSVAGHAAGLARPDSGEAERITALLPTVTGIEVHPARIELASRFDYVQLVLSATTIDGTRFDVTRAAELVSGTALARIDERGLVRVVPGSSGGTGELTFRLGEHQVVVPVAYVPGGTTYEPGFIPDVMPVLSKAGCTGGGCHGAQDGKNGFKLSLRGYDPFADHAALTDDLAGRRFDRVAPARSLFLLKPTAEVPHEGGQKIVPGSPDYQLLLAWVEGGARLDVARPRVQSIALFPASPTLAVAGASQQFAVLATFTDGSVRDVSAHAFVGTSDTEVTSIDDRGLVTALRRGEAGILARYEGAFAATRLIVMGDRAGFEWVPEPAHSFVDELVNAKLKRVRTLPSALCTDAEFLRRVSLDLTGRAPSPEAVRTFLVDARDTRVKREEVIERFIGSPEFVAYWSNKWSDLLQVNSKFLGREGAERTRAWVRAAVASNVPYDRFVADILRATGSTYENPAASYYKVLRKPDAVMENTTQLFLGVRFNCNKCHDHPFERWTQDQHWQLAAFFGQVGRKNAEGSKVMPKTAQNQIDGQPPAFEEVVFDMDDGEVRDPDSDVVVPPRFPYAVELEGDAQNAGEGDVEGDGDVELGRRERLTRWLTAPANPYFARSYVNRVWSYFMGVGLIDPVDDIRAGNPPSNPELLERLEDEFLASGFDVRDLMRTICRSRTYQRSIATNAWNADDFVNYSHARARRLPAEVLYDALHQATGSRPRLPGQRPGTRAADLVDTSVKTRDGFLDLFGRPPRESACECERSSGVSLGQALNLVNGSTVADAIEDPDSDLALLARFETDAARIVDELYLAFLCRPPSAAERSALAPTFDTTLLANRAALSPRDVADVERLQAEWEAARPSAEWRTARPTAAQSAGGATIEAQEDGSFLVSGNAPEKDTYTVFVEAGGPITGVRLEALPHESLAGGGPGRAENGNFVLGELRVAAFPIGDPTAARPLDLRNATADYSQGSWAVAGAIDGKLESGWAVMPRFGQEHQAVFETAEDIGAEAGVMLVVTIEQQYGQRHSLGRFRVSTTGSARPVRHHGLPADVAAALTVPVGERTEPELGLAYREFVRTHPDVAERVRLGATQDLAWALANSPGFLFNR